MTRAIKAVVDRIAGNSPAIAKHFESTLHTRAFGVYPRTHGRR